jgi:hypothetical protein
MLVDRSIDLCCIDLAAAGQYYFANLAAGQSCSWLLAKLAALAAINLAAFDLLLSICLSIDRSMLYQSCCCWPILSR